MVSVECELLSKQIDPPMAKSFHDGKELLFVNVIVFLSRIKSFAEEGDWVFLIEYL